jgi:hypothetical protein
MTGLDDDPATPRRAQDAARHGAIAICGEVDLHTTRPSFVSHSTTFDIYHSVTIFTAFLSRHEAKVQL